MCCLLCVFCRYYFVIYGLLFSWVCSIAFGVSVVGFGMIVIFAVFIALCVAFACFVSLTWDVGFGVRLGFWVCLIWFSGLLV